MTLVREKVPDAAVGVGVATSPDGFSVIRKSGCAAVIWRRQPLASFQRWIDAQSTDHLPSARIVLPAHAVRTALAELFQTSGLPESVERAMLVDDMAAMSDILAELMGAPFIRLRLDVVTTDACRKFHIDAVTARLICTYRGTGTQYGISIDGAEPKRVFTTPTASPLLLRGTLWPTSPKSGLMHRSPPIEGTGETRLVLVLDPVAGPSGEPASHNLH